MFEILRIILLGNQPIAKVDTRTLERILKRDFGNRANEAKQKLQSVNSSSNRILAAIIKLADKDFDKLDHYIDACNTDFRDILLLAEYPRCAKLGFEITKNIKLIYLKDWIEYSRWLNKN